MKARHHLAMNVYWFGLSFMWNGLHPILLPALLVERVPESLKNTYLGGLTFAGLIVAMLVQPVSGALSDRTRSRWGRRRPWIAGGTLLSLLALALMALSGDFATLLAAYLLLQFASNWAHGPAQGLIPDLVPERERGLASGIKNLFDMLGLVVASLIAGQLMGSGSPLLVFLVMGGLLATTTLFTLLAVRERPSTATTAAPGTTRLREMFDVGLQRYPAYAWLLLSRFLILVGIYAVQGFAQYFIRDVLRAPNPPEVTGNLMAAIGLPLTLLVYPAGILSDRFGRRRLNLLAGALIVPGILLLMLVRSVETLLVFGGLIGIGTGIFVSANWALATDLIPEEEAGKYLGLTNLATAGSAAVARLAGPLIDGINLLNPEVYPGYPVLFVLSAASVLAGTLLLFRIPARSPRGSASGT